MDTKEKILDTALIEFAKNGIEGARVDTIADKAGINKAMIYYHFGSKENLYQAVIECHLERIGNFVARTIEEEADLEKFLIKLSGFYNALSVERPTFFPIILREMITGGERIKVALTRIMGARGILRRLREMIDAGIDRGDFRKLDSRQVIVSFLGMNIFYMIFMPVMNSVWEIEDVKTFRENRPQAIVDLFLRGLKKC
jgi:TetR/AcrR family transcriptional regulator